MNILLFILITQIEQPKQRLVVEFNSIDIMMTHEDNIPKASGYREGITYRAGKDMVIFAQGNRDVIIDVSGIATKQELARARGGIVRIDKGEYFTVSGDADTYWRMPEAIINDRRYFDITKGKRK